MSANKCDELLRLTESLAEVMTEEKIHEIIEEAIQGAEGVCPNVDKERIKEFYYLIERHLVERARKKKEIIRKWEVGI